MKPLSAKKLERIKKELFEEGLGEVIDAQNVKQYIRKKRKKYRKAEQDAYNEKVGIDEVHDDFLDTLSLSKEESSRLLNQLSEEKVRDGTTSIADIDWKKVRTF